VLAALAASAATSLVQAVVTDGWEGIRHKVGRLFGRGRDDEPTERRLAQTRQELVTANPADLAQVQAMLAARWETRFADLVADYPDAEAELTALLPDLEAAAAMPVVATDHSVSAGRDVTVTAKGGSVAAGVIAGNVVVPAARLSDEPPDPTGPDPGVG
jgi:hypothetical protein